MHHTHAQPSDAAYSNIMVPVSLGSDSEQRIMVAADLADGFGASLTGIAGHRPILPIDSVMNFLDARILDGAQQRADEDLAAAETLFRRVTGTRNDLEWRSATCDPGVFAAQQARSADLIVVSRQRLNDQPQDRMGVPPGGLVMAAGRPVLMIPTTLTHVALEHVTIAWKDTREARRAVRDSLPLLQCAESVSVAVVGDKADRATAADVGTYLRRHNVQRVLSMVLEHRVEEGGEAGPLMRFAEAEGAGLIVAGAYGHSRSHEWFFGGVTRDLLRHAPVPCLLTH
jgi:nucleotide-binding universal stress UspA family protein